VNLIPDIRADVLQKSIARAHAQGIILPTFAQQKDPTLAPDAIKDRLKDVGLWDIDPANLFRITWKNEPVEHGGGFGEGNWIEFPPELTGVDATIVGIVGKWFPTGAHKVGAAYGCLVPRLVTGTFDPDTQKAVWPSTGNYCRGGAYDCALLDCPAIAILPEGMSRERFEWLREIGTDEIIATPGTESNVKEIIAAGDFLRTQHPGIRVVATEALQCPTLLQFGFGEHRIEGIGDKHIPWIHNVRNTNLVAAVDDEQTMQLMRLFNEDEGRECLRREGIAEDTIQALGEIGISGLCNLVASIKAARYYDMDGRDVIFTPLTDSMELYSSRMQEMQESHGPYTTHLADQHYGRYLQGTTPDYVRELNYADQKALHNFKYFTWVEQQGRTSDELRQLWDEDFWQEIFSENIVNEWDRLIDAFNNDGDRK